MARFEADREPEPPLIKVVDKDAELRERRVRRKRLAKRFGTVAYIVLVGAACFVFQFFGCLCMDRGDCGDWPVELLLGSNSTGWCFAIGGGGAANLYVTLPMAVWVALYYRWRLALRLAVQGAVLGIALAVMLALALYGRDLPSDFGEPELNGTIGLNGTVSAPPGFGISGVPVGAAIFAGLLAWALHSVAAFVGYYRNATLGTTCTRAASYLITCVGIGMLAAFEFQLWVGVGIFIVLIFVMGWTAQVWVTTGRKRLTVLAYLAPLVIGAAFGVPVEFLPDRFGMPASSGYAIGCGISLVATLTLSHAFETRGIAGARHLAAMLLAQDMVGLASWIAAYQLTWASGVFMAIALEALIAATIDTALREGNQFGAWQCVYPLMVLLAFSALLVTIFSTTWAAAVTVGNSTMLGVGIIVYFGFRRYGVIGGMRAIYLTLLCLVQVVLMMVEFLVVEMPAPLAIGFGCVAFVLLLIALVVGFRADDGSGKLYGSGVEVLVFVMSSQALCYTSGLVMYAALGATDTNAHISAGVLGALVLICPTITNSMAHSRVHAARNFRRGLWVAALLSALWLIAVLMLRFAFSLDMGLAVQLCSGYTGAFVFVMALAIHRFLFTTLLVYLIYLVHTLGALSLVFIYGIRVGPMATICILTFMGFGLPLPFVWPLSQQRSLQRENLALDELAKEVRETETRNRMRKDAKPMNNKRKHVAKAKELIKLESHGSLPKLHELSHNGVMERAGVVRWCRCGSDGRPVMPFTAQLVVARGSFLYLFPAAEGELLPTSRAVSAIPIFAAKIACVPQYYDDRMPLMQHLIHIHLRIAWHGMWYLYLQLRDEVQMRAWATDLQKRAKEEASNSKFREAIYEQAGLPDPSLAVGMLAVRKAMAHAATEKERVAVSRGITGYCEPPAAAAGPAAGRPLAPQKPKQAGLGGLLRRAGGATAEAAAPRRSQSPAVARRATPPPRRRSHSPGARGAAADGAMHGDGPAGTIKRNRIQRAVKRAEEAAAENQQELVATKVFDSVVMYTPRGCHGSANDMTLKYPVEHRRYPSLAASAREAQQLNEKAEEAARKQRTEWLRHGKPKEGSKDRYDVENQSHQHH